MSAKYFVIPLQSYMYMCYCPGSEFGINAAHGVDLVPQLRGRRVIPLHDQAVWHPRLLLHLRRILHI